MGGQRGGTLRRVPEAYKYGVPQLSIMTDERPKVSKRVLGNIYKSMHKRLSTTALYSTV
jgi:hypothetical protein